MHKKLTTVAPAAHSVTTPSRQSWDELQAIHCPMCIRKPASHTLRYASCHSRSRGVSRTCNFLIAKAKTAAFALQALPIHVLVESSNTRAIEALRAARGPQSRTVCCTLLCNTICTIEIYRARSSYWTVYNFFASQSQRKHKIIIFFFRRSKRQRKF